MLYTLSRIHHDAGIILGETPGLEQALTADETSAVLTLDKLVVQLLPRVAAEVIEQAPIHLVDTNKPLPFEPIPLSDRSGYIPLPPDFLRLAALKMPDWSRVLREVRAPSSVMTDPSFIIPVKLRRMASPAHPLLQFCQVGDGPALLFIGSDCPDATPDVADYIPYPSWKPDCSIRLPGSLYDKIIINLADKIKDCG
ncbi:MAG: hypothetical protein NC328_05955 [Muribaculum sp.]|nr:hypothetical protein [Muribaculum sp.]